MEQSALMAFLHRIILASGTGDQAVRALNELEGILKRQGISEADLALIESARQGMKDSAPRMQQELAAPSAPSPEMLQTAVTRAREQRVREEMEARNGRC